jgi:hypothetical protein
MKQPAWTDPDNPELEQRTTVAAIVLLVHDVRRLSVAGAIATPGESDAGGIDFFEFRDEKFGVGELRFVMNNDTEILVTGTKLELTTVG